MFIHFGGRCVKLPAGVGCSVLNRDHANLLLCLDSEKKNCSQTLICQLVLMSLIPPGVAEQFALAEASMNAWSPHVISDQPTADSVALHGMVQHGATCSVNRENTDS